jgi:exodeoxyribonuclease V gamma subunit
VPAGLTLHTSNQLEILARQLEEVIADPLGSPLTPEIIVVQSNGMRRWLVQQIAQSHGICSNVRFPFPQNFFHSLFEAAFPEAQSTEAYGRDAMTWRIMKLLPEMAPHPAFTSIATYLAGERAELRAYELARKIAHVFDQYLVFRPRMILDWDAGKGNDWQSMLWREVQRAAPQQHQVALGSQLVEALKRNTPVPERVSIFGISTLPPFYVSLIEEISARCPVHLFIMEPTPEWWGDIRSKREKARAKQPELFDLEQQNNVDNPLLAENGRLGRDFLNVVADLNPGREQQQFERPSADTILHKIQRDIFEMSAGIQENAGGAFIDQSLQIHSCHSVMRELEVLHDQLLALFASNVTLKPRDIVVMMPEVSVYAPFVDAVFGVPENPEYFIPYSIADRAPRARSGVIDTFLRILEILPGRFGASEILALLESPAVQRRFGIAEVEKIRRWIEKCAVRWGIDSEHRARLALPSFSENSWRHGLDRMLLGYAMQPDARELFEGILPFDEIEGSNAELLGNFVEFMEHLFARAVDFAKPRPPIAWQRDLLAAADEFLDADEAAQLELNQLRAALAELGRISAASGNDDAVSREIVVLQLERVLEQASSGAGFLSGAMTFCALKPMRSVPFKIVCLLGMNDTAYPRRDRAPEFDLIAQHRRPGDRNSRVDDRALFLEALLSARDVFYLSYLGQSMRDNSALPPSVVVSELSEYIEQRFATSAEKFVVKHSLQAFSPRNFGAVDKRCFSYSLDNSAAGQVAAENRHDPPPFFDKPLNEPDDRWREVDLGQLVDFFSHPAKFLLRQRLDIELPHDREEIEDREPFALHPLDRYAIEQRLLTETLDGRELESALAIVRASGALPPGATGSLIFEELCAGIRTFAGAVRHHVSAEKQPATAVRARIGEFNLSGTLDHIRGETLVHFRLAKLKAKDFLRVWIEHLALNLSEQKPAALYGKEEEEVAGYEFAPIRNAKEVLADLLALYWRGLCRPLPLFPRTSWTFTERIVAGKSEENARYAAGQIWRGNERDGRGEREDPYIRLAFLSVDDPLGQEWEKISRSVFAPIFSQRKRR